MFINYLLSLTDFLKFSNSSQQFKGLFLLSINFKQLIKSFLLFKTSFGISFNFGRDSNFVFNSSNLDLISIDDDLSFVLLSFGIDAFFNPESIVNKASFSNFDNREETISSRRFSAFCDLV